MNFPEPKPPDPHFHAFLLPILAFSCSSLLSFEHAQAAALGWSRKSGPFLAQPHNPCTTASTSGPAPAVAAAVVAATPSSTFLTAATNAFALAHLFHGSDLCALPVSCTTLLSFAHAHASSASITSTAPPSACLSLAHTNTFAPAGFFPGLLLTGPLLMGHPLFLCFGPQVSILLSHVHLHFLLLLSPYGELGLDLQIIGMELEFACRSVLMYSIIICGLTLIDHIYVSGYDLGSQPLVEGVVSSLSSIAWIIWISPYDASLVGAHWPQNL